ncbi:unnamed protein product, partial [Ectocarpus sp. 13 AM-2016]
NPPSTGSRLFALRPTPKPAALASWRLASRCVSGVTPRWPTSERPGSTACTRRSRTPRSSPRATTCCSPTRPPPYPAASRTPRPGRPWKRRRRNSCR